MEREARNKWCKRIVDFMIGFMNSRDFHSSSESVFHAETVHSWAVRFSEMATVDLHNKVVCVDLIALSDLLLHDSVLR